MPVTFKAEDHSYTSHTGEKYISVTTLIGLYTPPFDEDYWSAYKALKDVLVSKGEWNQYKALAGGWDYVVEYCRKLKGKFPYVKQVIDRKEEYIKEWDKKRKIALVKGTKFHNEKENTTKQARIVLPNLKEVPVRSGEDILAVQDFNSDGVYTELLIYSDEFQVAGQSDWVLKEGRYVDLKDYKTSAEIKTQAFMNETLLPPLTKYPNASFYIYSLQLSLYAYLLELKGYIPRKLFIEHAPGDVQEKMYPVNYERSAIKNLLEHYVKTNKNKNRRVRSKT